MGHAGSDYEPAYRRPDEITGDYNRDPVLCTAKLLISAGLLTPAEVLDRYEAKRSEVIELAREVSELPQLDSAAAVMEPLRDTLDEAVDAVPIGTPANASAGESPMTVALAINRALHDVLLNYPEALIFGEDVARKGGVYGVTRGLLKAGGPARVFDTLLDEQAILGPCARRRVVGTAADTGDPVPRLPAQRRGSDSRRRRHPAVLLEPAVPQPDGRSRRRVWLSERLRRALPQRQQHRRHPRHPRGRDRLAVASRRRRRNAARLRRGGPSVRRRLHLPRAHRAVPHQGPVRRWRRALARKVSGPWHGTDRAGPNLRRRHGLDDPHVRQRGAHESAGRPQARAHRYRGPRRRPALAGTTTGGGHDARSRRHRSRPRRRRDPQDRWSR